MKKNDQGTVLSKNLNTIADNYNVLVDNMFKQNLPFSKLPDDQSWKIPLIYELLDLRLNDFNYH